MSIDRPQPASFGTSALLFPSEWQALFAAFDDAQTGLLFMQDGIIVRINHTLEQQLGYEAAELLNQPLARILCATPPDEAGKTVRLVGKNGQPVAFQLTEERIDTLSDAGGTLWVLRPAAHGRCEEPAAARTQAVLDHLPDPVLVCAADSAICYASPAFDAVRGVPGGPHRQVRLLDLAHPEDQPKLRAAFDRMTGGEDAPLAFRLRVHDGRWRQFAGLGRGLGDRREIGGLLLTLRDVSGQVQELQNAAADKKRQLHYLNRLLRLALQPHPQVDSALRVILKATAKALGAQRCAYWQAGAEPSAARCLIAYDEVRQNVVTEATDTRLATAFHPLLQQVLSDERPLAVADVDLDPRAALACEYFHAASVKALLIVPVRDGGKIAGLLVVSQLQAARAWRKDETELANHCAGLLSLIFGQAENRRAIGQRREQAQRDSLTGLPNRQFLFERAADIFPRMTANSTTLAAFFIDLDGLKHVNEALGHAIGDELLKAVALRLKNLVRKDDVLARLGSDEFMLLAQNLDDMRIAEDIAQQIIDAVNAPFTLRGHELQVSVSVGIALYPFDGADIDTLMKKADIALYHAKSGGRNRYEMFSPRHGSRLSKQSVLESELRRAVRERELRHYYHPQVDLRTGKVRCVEALLRWHHPRQGLLLPSAFLPLAEHSGLIHTITRWVMNDACDQLRSWHKKGLEGLERFNIAINLAAGQLTDDGLLAVLEDALERTGVAAAQLEWEIQENTVMRHATMVTSLLDRLADLQIGLSIDDFGTGYSNLGYLRRYPVRKVKIDRSLIQSLPDEGDGRAITDAIILMAQPLGLDVVAEGVETARQMEYLRARGCHIAQGYYFTQPLTADQFETWLIRH